MLDVVTPEAALGVGERFVHVVEPDAEARAVALQAMLTTLEDGQTRVVRAGNPLRAKLTTERLLLQVSGAVTDALSEADMREAARALLQREGAERRVVLVIEQAETLAGGAMRSLEMLVSASRAHAGGPMLQVVLLGAERAGVHSGEHDEVESSTLPEMRPAEAAAADPVPLPPPVFARKRAAEAIAAAPEMRAGVAVAAVPEAPVVAVRLPPPKAVSPVDAVRATLVREDTRRRRMRFGAAAFVGSGLAIAVGVVLWATPWAGELRPAPGPAARPVPSSTAADRGVASARTGRDAPGTPPAAAAAPSAATPQSPTASAAAPAPGGEPPAASAAASTVDGRKPDLPAPAEAEMARLRREFDQFLINSGRSTARLTPAQRERLFEEFLGWRARRPGPDRGARP